MSIGFKLIQMKWFLFLFVLLNNKLESQATSPRFGCKHDKIITIDAKETHSGSISSPGYPNEIISSSCRYNIITGESSRVYVEFTEFDLPTCKDAFIELLSDHEDEGERGICLGKEDKIMNKCEFCNTAKPVPSHSQSNIVTLMVKFNVNSSSHKGFKMEWRSGEYGNFYNWVEDPINHHTGLILGIFLGIVGFLGLIVAPILLYRYRKRRSRQGVRVLLEQQDDDDSEDTL